MATPMKTTEIKVEKAECDDKSCPMPLEFITRTNKAIKSVKYDEKSQLATIQYDEDKISIEDLVKAIDKMGYKVLS